jgi:UDP-2-acetamido-3-amino-2,3-dideoxy-glucuronate N-acetyltransferase
MREPDSYFVHPAGICDAKEVGNGTRIWAFAHVLDGAAIGEDCNLCDHVFVEDDVVIGDRVTVKSGVQLWNGIRLENDVFVGPNATFTNDPLPRSRAYRETFPVTTVRAGASLGANCTILPGLTIGRGAMVGAGSVVTHDVPPNAIVAGNPARIVGYVDTYRADAPEAGISGRESEPRALQVRGASLSRLTQAMDMRGSLVAAESNREIPFIPRRAFIVTNVPSKDVRGEHAHRRCEQFMICVAGSVTLVLDDGKARDEVLLDQPSLGLYLPPMVWGIQYRYSSDAALLVLASRPYEPEDYIRDYDEFTALTS